MTEATFNARFETLTGHAPFPWQIELFREWFVKGEFPRSCNLPTGLGKTSVIAIWLIALMERRDKIPRRLVYVVNRRTVVDQTTDEVEKLRENLWKLGNLPNHAGELAISTLRGQFADNHEWSADPSKPAVICGTVDMIGSRLLFSGYRIGFKTRPLHAGFLGQDSLLIHDEAHLEPAFQVLLNAIEKEQQDGERSEEMPWPRLKVMALSATSRVNGTDVQEEKPFELTNREKNPPDIIPDPSTIPIHDVWKRLKARKGLKFYPTKRTEVAKMIGHIAHERKGSGGAILIFVRTIDDLKKVREVLTDKKEGVPAEQVQTLTGTKRGHERDRMVATDKVFARFLYEPKTTPQEGTVYLICTSAGEVGVDISADHMVCDLTTLDSMIQRLGRVNRRGDGAAEIDLVYEADPDPKPKSPEFEKARWKTKKIIEGLPSCDWPEDRHEASPLQLLNLQLSDDDRKAAFAPQPAILPVTDILFDAWALTTISPPLVRSPLPGRPPVEPYLHGISDWQPPQTQVAWREEVEVICGDLLERYKPEDLLEDYPLKPHELLQDRSDRVFDDLTKISVEHPDAPIWLLDSKNRIVVTSLRDLTQGDKKAINYITALLPPFVGGLTREGTLDGSTVRKKTSEDDEETDEASDRNVGVHYDVADEWYADKDCMLKRRTRVWSELSSLDGMILEREIRIENPESEDDEESVKIWRWFLRKPEATNERSRIAYELSPHLEEVNTCASEMVGNLDLPEDIRKAITLAAGFHDLGKNRERWQRGSLGNDWYPQKVYAKSGRLDDGTMLKPREFFKNYRHEFGSMLDLLDERHPPHAEFMMLSRDMQELVMHLIAAHHGRARPHFPTDEAFDPEPNSQNAAALATQTLRRFARLQRKYGRWGLAYLESLVRAADYAASAYPGKYTRAIAAEDQP